jgi:hypothetical protein
MGFNQPTKLGFNEIARTGSNPREWEPFFTSSQRLALKTLRKA